VKLKTAVGALMVMAVETLALVVAVATADGNGNGSQKRVSGGSSGDSG
jgi:hypothetical protein